MIQLQKLAMPNLCVPALLEAKLCSEQWQELQLFPHLETVVTLSNVHGTNLLAFFGNIF